MKVVVRLAIVVAVLLLVNNVAFAANCDGDSLQVAAQKMKYLCYNVTVTPDGGLAVPGTAQVCLEDDGIGWVIMTDVPLIGSLGNLFQFGGGPSWYNFPGNPMFGGKPQWTKWIIVSARGVAEIQPIGTALNILTGTGADFEPPESRFTISGMRVPCVFLP